MYVFASHALKVSRRLGHRLAAPITARTIAVLSIRVHRSACHIALCLRSRCFGVLTLAYSREPVFWMPRPSRR